VRVGRLDSGRSEHIGLILFDRGRQWVGRHGGESDIREKRKSVEWSKSAQVV
jgi:hypothetical protein